MSSLSSDPGGSNVGLPREAVSWTQSHSNIVAALPAPEYEWTWAELPDHEDTPTPFPDYVLHRHASLHQKTIIREVRVVRVEGNDHRVWTTDPRLYEYAQSVEAERGDRLPCEPNPHRRGFQTVNAEAGIYECGHPDCDELYDRATIEEVFG